MWEKIRENTRKTTERDVKDDSDDEEYGGEWEWCGEDDYNKHEGKDDYNEDGSDDHWILADFRGTHSRSDSYHLCHWNCHDY